MKATLALLLVVAAILPRGALAQQTAAAGAGPAAPTSPTVVDALKQFSDVDLSVPESPAFAILGITPSAVQRPGTVRALASSIVQGLDSNGKPKNGIAIDFAPLPLAAPQMIVGGKRYEDSLATQIFTRTTVSLATAAVSGGGSQQAWGVRIGLLDQGDPGLYSDTLMSCINTVSLPAPAPGMNVDPPNTSTADETRKAIAACDVSSKVALWAKPALYVGFGQAWYSATGALNDRSPASRAFWATYSIGREVANMRTLLMLHAERKTDDRTPDPADASKLLRQDSTGLVARLQTGADVWHAFAELGRSRVSLETQPRSNVRHTAVGAEYRIKDDFWLQVGEVVESGLQDGTSHRQVTAGLRFGSAPFLATPGK